jgi:hypothetical protein
MILSQPITFPVLEQEARLRHNFQLVFDRI